MGVEVPRAVLRMTATLESRRDSHSYQTGAVLSWRARRWGNAVRDTGIIIYADAY